MRGSHAHQYGIPCAIVDSGDTVTAQQVIDFCQAIGAVRMVDGTEFCAQLRADVGPELWTGDALRASLRQPETTIGADAPGFPTD